MHYDSNTFDFYSKMENIENELGKKIFIIAFTAVGISELYYEKNEKIRTDQIANSQVEKLQHVINGLLFTTRTVEALLLEDPARSIEAQAAKDSRQLTLAGPYILRQGGIRCHRQASYLSGKGQ